jgi:predicted phage-related endonuclease
MDDFYREYWLRQRHDRITASDVAILLGESKYHSRDDLIERKSTRYEQLAHYASESTEIGQELEPAIIEIARKRYGWQLERNHALLLDPSCERLGATPDAFMTSPWGRAVVQIKFTSCQPPEKCKPTRRDGAPSGAAFAFGAPLDYQIQIQAELAVTGLDHGVLLVLHSAGGFALRAYYVPRHEAVIERIRREVVAAWAEIEHRREKWLI